MLSKTHANRVSPARIKFTQQHNECTLPHFRFYHSSCSFITYFSCHQTFLVYRIAQHLEMNIERNESCKSNILYIQHIGAITASSPDVCSKISKVFSSDKRYIKEKLCFIKLYPLSTRITATLKKHFCHKHWTVNCIQLQIQSEKKLDKGTSLTSFNETFTTLHYFCFHVTEETSLIPKLMFYTLTVSMNVLGLPSISSWLH